MEAFGDGFQAAGASPLLFKNNRKGEEVTSLHDPLRNFEAQDAAFARALGRAPVIKPKWVYVAKKRSAWADFKVGEVRTFPTDKLSRGASLLSAAHRCASRRGQVWKLSSHWTGDSIEITRLA